MERIAINSRVQPPFGRLEATKEPPSVRETIARRLVWCRQLKGWSQAELALRSGVGRQTVCAAEGGQLDIRMRTLQAFAAAFDTTIVFLLGGDYPADLLSEDAARRRV